MKITDFAGCEPRFLPERFFAGKSRAWGLFQDRFGRVRRQFVVDIDGRWDGTTLTLDEDFHYADGEKDARTWVLTSPGPGLYEGSAAGVVGVARGETRGNAFHWRYRIALPVGGRRVVVAFDDWMFLQPDGVVLNRARVSKLGVALGEVFISFQGRAPSEGGA